MNINSSMRGLIKPARLALVAGVATLLVGAVLDLPAAAAATTLQHQDSGLILRPSATRAVTGQAVTFTATVEPLNGNGRVDMNAPTPQGTVVFSVTGADSSTPVCDGGDTVTLSGGTASVTFSGGLLASGSRIPGDRHLHR